MVKSLITIASLLTVSASAALAHDTGKPHTHGSEFDFPTTIRLHEIEIIPFDPEAAHDHEECSSTREFYI